MIHIGITGHRFLSDVEKLKAGVNQILARIEKKYPGQDWVVISSLAEGADRLVAGWMREFKPAVQLVVPLPLPVDEYRKDFKTEESRQEFQNWLNLAVEVIPPPEAARRADGYRAAGIYVLEHCDILIALWDGLEAQGRGGTGEIVALARERRMPLAWVYSPRPHSNEMQSHYPGQKAGTVSFERFDGEN
jgi:hypothetical protein